MGTAVGSAGIIRSGFVVTSCVVWALLLLASCARHPCHVSVRQEVAAEAGYCRAQAGTGIRMCFVRAVFVCAAFSAPCLCETVISRPSVAAEAGYCHAQEGTGMVLRLIRAELVCAAFLAPVCARRSYCVRVGQMVAPKPDLAMLR